MTEYEQAVKDFKWIESEYQYGGVVEMIPEYDMGRLLFSILEKLTPAGTIRVLRDVIQKFCYKVAPVSMVENPEMWRIAERQGCLNQLRSRADFLGIDDPRPQS